MSRLRLDLKNCIRSVAYAAYDFIESGAVDPENRAWWDQFRTRMAPAKRTSRRNSSDLIDLPKSFIRLRTRR